MHTILISKALIKLCAIGGLNKVDDFENMLLNVRNSFRLLYFFNRRVLDLMKYIGKKFSIPYAGGYSKFSASSPKDGKGDLDCWAWDWMNLYFYEFHFFKEKIRFSILLQSDTGKWDADVDHLDVQKFESALKSKTKLIFVFSNNDCWNFDQVTENENLKSEYTETFEISENNESMYCMVFNINEFKNKALTDNSLRKFITYLNKNKIYDINIVDDNFQK